MMASTTLEATGSLEMALAHARRLLRSSPAAAAEQAREILRVVPEHLETLGLLATALRLADDPVGADAALARQIRASVRDPQLREAATALCDNRLAVAEALLRTHLKAKPADVAAIRMLAEIGARLGRYGDAEALLARCLALAPGFAAARHNYAVVLHRQSKSAKALAEVERLLGQDPANPNYCNLHAAVLARLGEYERAIEVYADVLAAYPNQPKGWMSYGHALKTVGRQADSIAAYRRSIELLPSFGEAYWSLANLKTFHFTADDIAAMRAQLARGDLASEDRFHFHFALGKAFEDAGDAAGAFEAYAQGNALRRAGIDYDADENAAHVRRSKALFTRAFFAARAGGGDPAPDPIFVVGLPRSGSTLVEQILASHSQVEGTQELPDIGAIANRLSGRKARGQPSLYPEALAELSPDELRALGADYLERTRIQRKTSRPFFIDKMPNNFAHVGLVQLILPNAKIIDARRHPLGCCFSAFKQHFARGQAFTYDLAELGRYYTDYVELMAHFDAVLPGRVHRVFYEDMVAETEGEVRRLLDHCGLPFEEACLRFYENDRAVRTASSEQVRRPIFREATDHWRQFEPWLGPLKAALGTVLQRYPAVPAFASGGIEDAPAKI
jgi:tetratricopeptide (TPR) repeat protein